MDGNGRWAQLRGSVRTWGHREGAKRVDDIVTECCRLGVRYLTLYAFSTENWSRPPHEVNMLMRLLVTHLSTMDKKLLRNKVSLRAQGTLNRLPGYVIKEINRVISATTRPDPALILTLCLSYGGRQEIVDAVKQIARKVEGGELRSDMIEEATVSAHLYQPEIPDPDLLIRTGGEYRVSNFLLWEIAYSEIFVTPTLWPDFKEASLGDAIAAYSTRERRFGLTAAQLGDAPQPSMPA